LEFLSGTDYFSDRGVVLHATLDFYFRISNSFSFHAGPLIGFQRSWSNTLPEKRIDYTYGVGSAMGIYYSITTNGFEILK